jgi:DHA1 family tetracycline resistance protein-like MFS transporter
VLYAEYRYDWGPQAVAGCWRWSASAAGGERAAGESARSRRGASDGRCWSAWPAAWPGSRSTAGRRPGRWFLCGIPIMAIWALSMPANAGAGHAPGRAPMRRGRIQGALSSLVSLAGIVGPLLYTSVFALFHQQPCPRAPAGAPFLLACADAGGRRLWWPGAPRARHNRLRPPRPPRSNSDPAPPARDRACDQRDALPSPRSRSRSRGRRCRRTVS